MTILDTHDIDINKTIAPIKTSIRLKYNKKQNKLKNKLNQINHTEF